MTQHNISISDISINASASTVNISTNTSDNKNNIEKHRFALSVFFWIISTVEVPIMLLTLYALCLLRAHRAASVFVIHLILSDLIQTFCQMIFAIGNIGTEFLWNACWYSVIVSMYFMACVAFERYLLVCHPIWHKTHETLKSTCLISVIVWFVPLIFADLKEPPYLRFFALPFSIACLIPYLITILCFVGTWRSLSHSISLTSQKRKMILCSLFLVLLNYTFLFLPLMVVFIFHYITNFRYRFIPALVKTEDFLLCQMFLSPLADCLLYLFMRADAADVMPSLHCCCRCDTQQISVQYTTRTTQSSSS